MASADDEEDGLTTEAHHDQGPPKPSMGLGARIAQTFVVDGALAIVGLAAGIIVARAAGPSGLRDFGVVVTSVSLLSAAAQTGLPQATVYLSKTVPRERLTPNVLLLGAGLGAATAAALVLIIFGFGLRPFGLDIRILTLAIIATPFIFISSAAAGIVQGRYLATQYQFVRVAPSLLNLILLAGVALSPTTPAVYVTACWMFAQIGGAVVATFIVLSGNPPAGFSWRPERQLCLHLLRYGSRTNIGNMVKYLQYRTDVVILGIFLPSQEVGWYLVAISIAEIPWRIPSAVGAMLFPRIALESSETERNRITASAARQTCLLTAVVGGVLLLTAPLIIPALYGEAYAPAVTVSRLLVPGIAALGLWKILAQDLIARGRPNAYTLSAACSLGLLVIGCGALIPGYGLIGGAVASSLSYVAATGVIVFWYSRITGTPQRSLIVPSTEDLRLYRAPLSSLLALARRH